MNLTKFAVDNSVLTNFLVFLIFVGGIYSYFALGQLEDPDFTVKTGVIITQYPGASPREVELEVTDRIETAIQEMPQLRYLISYSKAGLSIIKVDMKQEYWADRLPQVWDEMRKKIRDITPELPPGAMKPQVSDDFSFVFGFVLAMTGDGYSYAELEEYAKALRKELSVVPGVSRADLWGVQPKVIYLDISEPQLAELQVSSEDIIATLAAQNMVVDGGSIEVPGKRLRVETTGEFGSPEEIGELVIRRSLLDVASQVGVQLAPYGSAVEASRPVGAAVSSSRARARAGELIRVKDVATVRQGYLEPPIQMMRFNGQPALAIQIANITGGNIVQTGKNIDARLAELLPLLPAGIEVERFVWQSELVEESIGGFILNLVAAVVIVLVVLFLAMGWRMAVIIGWALVLTILGTIIVMKGMAIDLQRVSLGAFVIALGMMVDNAIVVADNSAVGMARGKKPIEAAIEAASKPSIALLGATIVAAMAFYAIFAAKADTGEYARTLFIVVGVSLLLSWLVAMTVTPLNCIGLLKPPPPRKAGEAEADPFDTPFFRFYRRVLEGCIRHRFATIGAMTALLVAAIVGFQGIPQQFFPDSTRAQFRIDYWGPQGTPIQVVSEDVRAIEERLKDDPRVRSVGTFIGMGGPRFYLPVDPEFPYPEYAQIIVNTHSFEDVDGLYTEMEAWTNEAFPQALMRVRKYTVGPGDDWPFELRISGPAEADLGTLRRLAGEVMAILEESPYAKHVRTDMRQRTQKVVAYYAQERARWSSVSRKDIAVATQRAYDGTPVGLYREGDTLYPIIARNTEEERRRAPGELDVVQVHPLLGTKTIPLGQVTDDIGVEWEDPIIVRFQRRRQAAVQASPDGVTFPTMRASVIDKIEAIELPPGYSLFWDGEVDSTVTAQKSLIPGMVPAAVVIVVIMVALFNAIRPPLVILLVVPFAIIGITAILLPTQTPFGFMALLGAMSLVGLMIKNAIVLIDEINANKAAGQAPYDATVAAGVSRLRPVVLGAATTILGVVPLLTDAFWISMAMTIMAGLTFGTILTMVLIPVFYATLHRIPSPKAA
ncbi:MAG: efflux RND transporter permease subunit [Alphaproteobacteria bacterium]|nr:efflux RND transporter permease subunit [Alphaproteobacteria bacterium]